MVYRSLLRRMSPEHKFSCQAKLVAEVRRGCRSLIELKPTLVHP